MAEGFDRQVTILFETNKDLMQFKADSKCNDFYIDRDLLLLTGTFTETQLCLATEKFNGVISIEERE